MRKLKILFAEAAPDYGGQERYIHRLMLQLREQGHEVEMLCQPHAQLRYFLEQDGFVVHTVRMKKGLDFWRNLFRLRKFFKAHHYDVVNTASRIDTVQVGIPARLAGVPLVVRSRHLAKPIGSLLTYKWIPHRLITVSEFVRKQITDRGINPDYVDIAPPAVDFPIPLPPQKLREELGLTDSDLIVGSIAVLRRDKGMDSLINAMYPLLGGDPQVHLVIVGDGGEMQKLQAQVQQAGIESQVHFLGNRNDVPELIGDFDVFALATHIEASGTAFAEAAAARVPVVGTDVGGVSEMMAPGKSGFVVPLGDVPALTQAISRLLEDPVLRQKMGDVGYQYAIVENRFTLSALCDQTERSYYRWLEQLQHV